ncbi:hypothetical protein CRYUN_Cryun38cG0049800 [Craigia yunnanensis]
MAELGMTVAGGVAENLVVEYLVKPVIRNLRYAFCFGNIVKDFREQTERLNAARDRLRCDVEEAIQQTEEIHQDVQNWFRKFDGVQNEVVGLETKIGENRRCFSWCPNECCRWSLSKKVANTTLSVKELIQISGFDGVGYRSIGSGPESSSNNFITFESRKSAFGQIMEALKDDNVNMIGLHGMGGMGKTTLVKEVQMEANKLNLFDHVVMALVSQKPEVENIQNRIADRLGLQFTEKSVEGRADRLKMRLGNGDKILIILDDVWREVDMEEIGIPHGQNNRSCKILLTTRRLNACAIMRCQRIIELQVLEEKEAHKLFEINADLYNPSGQILKVATDIAKRCKGLPLAIITLGKALRGKSLNGWKEASLKLQSCSRLMDAIEGDKDVYTCLMVSYTFLRVPKTKQCFLLCASFPDYEIDVEHLVRCAWGLELYRGATLDEARTYVLAAVDDLRDSSLLLASGERSIKMHDMFRDVGLFIRDRLLQAPQEGSSSATSGDGSLEWLRNEISFTPYKVISLMGNEIKEAFPPNTQESLQVLSLVNVHETISSREFFEKMKELKVLTIAGGSLKIISPLDVFDYVKELRTLNLVFCGVVHFSSLSELKKLEILTIHDTDIEELPDEIVKLKNLRLLDLSECGCLRRIPPLLLQTLSRLEELYIGRFTKWATSLEESNARLSELNSLARLSVLSLAVAPTSLPNDFVFPKLDKYEIVIDESRNSGYPTTRSLQIMKAESLNAFKNLFPDVQYLKLDGIGGVQNLVPSLDQEGFTELTSLALESCQDMKYLVEGVVTAQPQHNQQLVNLSCLSVLTTLKIANCSKLEYIFPVSLAENLPPLRVFHLNNLPQLKDVLGPVNEHQRNYVVIKLPTLQDLKVTNCPRLSAFVVSAEIQEFRIFHSGESSQSSDAITAQLRPRLQNMEFFAIGNFQYKFQFEPETTVSKLKVLHLNGLNGLHVIWRAPNQRVTLKYLAELVLIDCKSLKYIFSPTLDLPQLTILKIIRCHGLKHILQNWHQIATSSKSKQRHSEHLGFPNLCHINIESSEELQSLFPASVGHCLEKLEVLCVEDAPKLKQVFGENEADVKDKKSEHPKLGSLVLQKLPNLESFCPLGHHFQFPSLNQLLVTGCPMMITNFSIDSNLYAHAKTKAPGPVDRNKKDGSSATVEELTWPVGSDINWQRQQKGIN